MDYTARRLARALRAWVGTHDVLSEYPLVSVAVAAGSGTEDSVVVQAYETPPDDLIKLLEQDSAARLGANPDAGGAYDSLVFHSLRLRHLMASGVALADHRDPAVVETATEALVSLSELVREVVVLVKDVRDPMIENLEAGLLRPGTSTNKEQLGDVLHRPMSSGDDLVADLLSMAAAVASLREVDPELNELQPRLVPNEEFVLEAALSGRGAIGRYHVRVFRPPTHRTTVVLGQLTDNGAQSVTNGVEHLARFVAALELERAELATARWVQYDPAPAFAAPSRQDDFTSVEFEQPEQLSGPSWQHLDPMRLQEDLQGGVQRYMAREYNSITLRRRGVRLVTKDRTA